MATGEPMAGPQVVVVGGSTAGLYCAYLLARERLKVLVVEQAEQLGTPERTLIVTKGLERFCPEAVAQSTVNRTDLIHLHSASRTVSIDLRDPDLIVERGLLVRQLARAAAAAGADIQLGCRFLGLEKENDTLAVQLVERRTGRARVVRTKVLIGADGVSSEVARVAELGTPRTVSLRQAKVLMPSWSGARDTHVWFQPGSTPYFYWLVPESARRAVAGLVAETPRDAEESLDGFLHSLGMESLGYQAAQVAISTNCWPPCWEGRSSRILLVGDAAGHVKVTTVGGVVTGLWGAQAAARAVLRGTSYGQELRGLRMQLALHSMVRRVLQGFSPSDYDELLASLGPRARAILGTHTRDEIPRVLVSALLASPRLAWMAVRPWLRNGRFGGRAQPRASAIEG